MCKYCNETLYRHEYKPFVSDAEMYDSIDKKFCSECGNLLGEVKPLTVEQLREMDGMPVWLETGEVSINEQIIGRWHIIHSISDTYVVFMGGGTGLHLDNYGKTWACYPQDPKE